MSTRAYREENTTRRNNITDGYMTVFLTLTMSVLLSLCLTLIEGARYGAVRMESVLASNIAADSIMAEYHRELAKQFNIFAIEDSYGTERASLENTESHLANYLNKNLSGSDFFLSSLLYRDFLSLGAKNAELEGVLYLSDERGEVFRRRAYEALKDDIGIDLITEIVESAKYITENKLESMDLNGEMSKLQSQVNSGQAAALEDKQNRESQKDEAGETEKQLPADTSRQVEVVDTNPTRNATQLTNPLLLYQYVEDVNELSQNTIDKSKLFSSRKREGMINSGNLKLEDENGFEDVIERFVFQEYLMKYFGRYRSEGKDDTLKYQIEYMITGLGADMDNFVSIVGRILGIRFAIDYLYILSDEEKCEIAEVLGTVISVYTWTEPLADVYKALILLMWAGTEAQYDVKCILAGSRIELIKTQENWHSNIENGMALLSEETDGDETGLSYEDYLRIFMLMTNGELLTVRAMDMVEADIRLTPGNSSFRIDACIDTVAVHIETYSSFGYGYEYRIKRKYE